MKLAHDLIVYYEDKYDRSSDDFYGSRAHRRGDYGMDGIDWAIACEVHHAYHFAGPIWILRPSARTIHQLLPTNKERENPCGWPTI